MTDKFCLLCLACAVICAIGNCFGEPDKFHKRSAVIGWLNAIIWIVIYMTKS